MLHDTDKVTEADIDHLDALLLDIGKQVVGTFEHLSSINMTGDVLYGSSYELLDRHCCVSSV